MLFSIRPAGNFGNRAIAYMVAIAVGQHFPSPITYNCSLPELGHEFDEDLHKRLRAEQRGTYTVHERDIGSLPETVEKIKSSGATSVVFEGFFQRYEYFEPVEFYRALLFRKQRLDIEPFADNDLVINIRTGDILGGGVSWYPLVPVTFYETLIRNTRCNPVFMGQLDDCAYVREIRNAFPNARMIQSGGAMTDFNRLMHAKRLCISVSTFSWLAAWLSDATEIHYPLLGFLHPFTLPPRETVSCGTDLTPLPDPRYRYHLLPVLNAEPELEFLKLTRQFHPISQAVTRGFAAGLSLKAKTAFREIDVTAHRIYFKKYPDSAWSVSAGQATSVLTHYETIGKPHGYRLTEGPSRPPLENLALRKAATQSSVSQWSHGKTPEKDAAGGVDGVTDGQYSFHTDNEDQPWWCVDLGRTCTIFEIWAFNRIENATVAQRTNHMAIEVGGSKDTFQEVFVYSSDQPFGGADGNPLIFRPETPLTGRFVRLRLLTRNCLHLDQVEVYGTPRAEG